VAFGADGNILVTTSFNGSGWVPLRKVNPATRAVSVIQPSIRQDSMLCASGDRQIIAWAESNISDGPVGRYRVSDGNVANGYGTGWFNFEIAANRNGTQFAVPTYNGLYKYDVYLARSSAPVLGTYAGELPIGGAYDPTKDVAYFAWAGTARVKAYNTVTFEQLADYDFTDSFSWTGHAYAQGRTKLSRDGTILFVTVNGGVRYLGGP
jgi:hypothetical protein